MSTCERCTCPVSQFVTDPADMRRVCPCVVSFRVMLRANKKKRVAEWYDAWLAEMRARVMQGSLLEV